MPGIITASMLYDLVQCPHRFSMDVFADPATKDPENAFVKLLWEKGTTLEREVMENLALPFVDLRPHKDHERERLTMEAMRYGEKLIYGGRIRSGDLLGDPDLLRKEEGGYMAGDIKSGAGEEGGSEDDEGKPKKHYAVQLALYTDILEKLNLSAGRCAFVWDVHGEEVIYDFTVPRSARKRESLWKLYEDSLKAARAVLDRKEQTLPALGAPCKLCHWRTECTCQVERLDDLTLIPELGRFRRDAILPHIASVKELASRDLGPLIKGKKTVISGVGTETLQKFQARARLQVEPGAQPYLKERVVFPEADLELFFDIETDPLRDICYLHGFVERRGGDSKTERYMAFLADKPTQQEEKRAFQEAWAYVQASRPCVIYYYSPYERTFWRRLQKLYPDVATEAEIDSMFIYPKVVDLYTDVVRSKTEWPTRDYSLKTLAYYLGFNWRDPSPSGAASVEWYHRWIETGDSGIRQRILDYNEDDCVATRVLLDGVRTLPVR